MVLLISPFCRIDRGVLVSTHRQAAMKKRVTLFRSALPFVLLFLLLLLVATRPTVVVAQIFGVRSGTGSLADTNILSLVPNSGTLIINYDFFTIPDTLDVFYGSQDIFSSGLVAGAGQFVIPYSGADTSLMIVINIEGSVSPATSWQYQPTVVPEPRSIGLFTCGIVCSIARWKHKGRKKLIIVGQGQL